MTFWISATISWWDLRLSFYLLRRNLGKGEDFRYQTWREEEGGRFAKKK